MAGLPRWYRSSPWIGLLGGLVLGISAHLELDVRGTWWLDTLGVTALFDVFAPLGYLVTAAVGFTLGWAFRWVEREYIHSE